MLLAPSITRPANQSVTIVPFTLKYESAVGLFGAENYFVKVQLDIQNNAQGTCYEEPFWLCGFVDYGYDVMDPYYGTGIVDKNNFTYTDSYGTSISHRNVFTVSARTRCIC